MVWVYCVEEEKMTDFKERFFQWQNYVHYLLNALLLWFEWENITATSAIGLITTFTILIFMNDTIIHALFWVLPKEVVGIEVQWRD